MRSARSVVLAVAAVVSGSLILAVVIAVGASVVVAVGITLTVSVTLALPVTLAVAAAVAACFVAAAAAAVTLAVALWLSSCAIHPKQYRDRRGAMACCSRLVVETTTTLLWCVFVALDMLMGLFYYPWRWLRQCRYQQDRAEVSEDVEVPSQPVNRKTVVIVGGSFGGLTALKHLADDPGFRVVLIDQREYFEYTPGVLRLFCDPSLFSTMARPTPPGTHKFLLGTVTNVADDHVVVACRDGRTQQVDFDYLVLAVGADYSKPVTPSAQEHTLAARAATWQKEAAKVQAAGSILVLGGGAVGAELAAEIICHFPQKRVTIVDAYQNLLPLFPRKTGIYAEQWFRDHGVELVLGEMLEKWDESSCTTKSGRVLQADLVYVCFGMRCNSQCAAGGSLAGSLGPRRDVLVNEFLQVEGQQCVFAVGDVMSHPAGEIKQAYYAEMNGAVAAENILHHARGSPLLRYPEAMAGAQISPLVYVVSLGRYDGSLGFNKLVVNGVLAAILKWIVEWTKVRQMEGSPIGMAVWKLGDEVTFALSRNVFPPLAKGQD
mmetsp:Transcript_84632/g.149889  ORF Transcript_84632/g.149889 Transcript_84632/m.149889 type:complete len:547 (+) Transcript_84632:46-1686(+)